MTTPRQTSVAIVGGGIGGLAAALSLLRAGFDVQVYEQAAALGEVGARINIGPNASRILHRLGLEAVLERIGVKPVAFRKNAMAGSSTDWSLAAIAWLYEHDAEVVNGR